MRVLVACEFSGVVREAFRRRGHDAWSCDLLKAEDGSEFHIEGGAERAATTGRIPWDLVIAHPPCTHLAVSGARWFKERQEEQKWAIVVEGRTPRVHYASPGPDRWKERSRTLQGIADAMAEQWGAPADLER